MYCSVPSGEYTAYTPGVAGNAVGCPASSRTGRASTSPIASGASATAA